MIICEHFPVWSPDGPTCPGGCGPTGQFTDDVDPNDACKQFLVGNHFCFPNPSSDHCFSCFRNQYFIKITNVGDNTDCSCKPCKDGKFEDNPPVFIPVDQAPGTYPFPASRVTVIIPSGGILSGNPVQVFD
jgi:hypothetical protein